MPSTVTASANNGTHTASQLLTEINGVVSTATFGELTRSEGTTDELNFFVFMPDQFGINV